MKNSSFPKTTSFNIWTKGMFAYGVLFKREGMKGYLYSDLFQEICEDEFTGENWNSFRHIVEKICRKSYIITYYIINLSLTFN